jgi:aspartate/methionine/tyrosine aminotransferase
MKPSAQRIVDMRRSGIREVMDLAAGLPDVLHLEVGEPNFATPDHVLEAAARAAADGFTKYTANRGLASLRETICGKLERVNGIRATPDQIVVTTGGVTALMETLIALTDPGDGVLIPDPGWPNYEMMAAVVGADVRRYPLDPAKAYEPDLDRLDELASDPRAKVLIINSPANPTGSVWSPETMARVVALAARHDLWVISDEVYEEIVFEGRHVSPSTIDDGGRVISVFSVSKTYAMTGWRIGYLVASEPMAALVAKVQEPVISCPTAVAQKAAEAAIGGPQECVALMRTAYRERRDLAVDALRRDGCLASEPHGAFYILADVSSATRDTYALARRLVAEQGVAVAPGETFGPAGAGLVRLSLATDPVVLAEGIRRLTAAIAHWTEA